ncbi:hypothetical protein F2Q69_00001870 [Brassica cretica]|uniref:STAR protein homodimerisation region domain-containing protein n=1 Tax=Brassica cretica TaxID=69181 RepID=A0A8S9P2K2_BRACR|nr:hypothetical protein F2Q69_00001870 [Brassica cretica]
MSGLYNNNSSYFSSPARAASPQIRSTPPEIDSSQYLTELLAEHQKLTPFTQVLPICSRLLNQGFSFYLTLFLIFNSNFLICFFSEMFRVSGMMSSNQGFGDFDRLRHRSPISAVTSASFLLVVYRKKKEGNRAQNPSPMSGLYNNNSSYFSSPARAASPQIRSTPPEIDSSQYLTELLAEHQKLTPFTQVLPICSRLLNQGFSFYLTLFLIFNSNFLICFFSGMFESISVVTL